jgi:hypothetical protein
MTLLEGNSPLEIRSALLKKLAGLGLSLPDDLARVAVVRGLRYYDVYHEGADLREQERLKIPCEVLSNAELGIAMLSPDLPVPGAPLLQVRQRIAAAVLSAEDVDPARLAELAVAEGCCPMVRWIATCGKEVEPENPFWTDLLSWLPEVAKPDRAPHPTRFFEMTGMTREKIGIQKRWLRLRIN